MNTLIATHRKSEPVTASRRCAAPRRGMALLFVVSLILFITLLGASFVVVSTQFSTSAKTRARIEARGDSSRAYVYRTLYDLLRGPEVTNTSSPLLCQDILSDQYGYGFAGNVINATNASAATGIPGTIEFSFGGPGGATATRLGPGGGTLNFGVDPKLNVAGLFNGQVLTFTDGELRGTSLRIIGYSGSQPGVATGLPFSFLVYQTQSNNTVAAPAVLNGDRVVVNGRAFAGWGGGGPNLSGVGAQQLAANALRPFLGAAGVNPAVYASTGVNESYDAPNEQNMFLAGIDPLGGFMASFERQDLYVNQGGAAGTSFRAFGIPGDPATLHVDNDGDGNTDSIWMDLGFPVQTDIDGRRYKPLAAILVLDMDGRLNVNAHGNQFQIDVVNNVTGLPGADGLPDVAASNLPLLGAFNALPPGSMIADFGFRGPPRGQFLGPPEVNLAPAFGTGPPTVAMGPDGLLNLLRARYGNDTYPGIAGLRDSWSTVSLYGHPDGSINFNNNRFVGGYYGSAMDVNGRFGVGIPNVANGAVPIDRPATDLITTLPVNDINDSPYEFSLLPQSRYPVGGVMSDDAPFTPKEVERFLRRYDRDSKMLPSRLWDIAPDPTAIRNIITSESWEVPALPTFEPVVALGEAAGEPVSIPQRVYNLLLANGVAPALANAAMEDLLSLDVRMGLPFDINRPFGNSSDENSNGTYDEASSTVALSTDPAVNETAGGETVATVNGINAFDGNGDGFSNANDFLARYEFAKQLYVLALLATGDTTAAPPVPPRLDYDLISDPDTLRRIALAQWVINIVDFRDSDSINTPFEIDFNPFDGWQPDGDPSTPDSSFVVWGVERPELLISETMATHDRRTQDLASVGPGATPSDPDFDSKLVPRAAAFVELYHPWNQNSDNQLMPAELMDPARTGIDLQRRTSSGDPVWRLVAVRDGGMNVNPERVKFAEADIARRVYFVPPNFANNGPDSFGGGPVFAGSKVYFPSAAAASDGIITPGGYAVIGSSGVGTGAAIGETFFGRRTDNPALLNRTRKIILDNTTRRVTVLDPLNGSSIRNDVAAIPIDQHYDTITMAAVARSLGLSDPDGGYPGAKIAGLDGLEFVTGIDLPVDADPAIQPPNDILATRTDGTTAAYRELFLQRLANPLAPWDPVSNPYLTVDSKTVDLTAFNGVEDDSADMPPLAAGDTVFASSERGRLEDPHYASVFPFQMRRRLWPVEEPTSNLPTLGALPAFATLAGTDMHVFSFDLQESFGLLNEAYTDQVPRMPSELTTGPNPPLGFANLPFNNRPFSSQMDLLDVPYTDGRDLLYLFSVDPFNSAPDPYSGPAANPRFGHLLNFFALPESPPGPLPSGMSALLDYIRVPSRFAGTNIHLDDSTTLLPPFNLLSRYREPGKININSLFSTRVREGWLGEYSRGVAVDGQNVDGSLHSYVIAPFPVADFENSRRNPGPVGANPERFDNPVRFANDYNKVPLDSLVARDGANEAPVMVTAMRNDPLGGSTVPLLDVQSDLPSAHSLRDSWARHAAFRKIGNTTTTRSSVFSIWITVGKFEVDADGALLLDAMGNGIELGSDTGKTERSRGFFMIDRSIPVAFEPGKNHNIENMILTETIIE